MALFSSLSERPLPLLAEADVAVCGGGLSGVAAALAAAGNGQATVWVARRPQPGWEVTAAFETELRSVTGPTWEAVRPLLKALGGWREGQVDPPLLEMALVRLLRERGVQVLLYCTPIALAHNGETAAAVVVAHKSGLSRIAARAFVDATEEGTLWRALTPPSPPFGRGREEERVPFVSGEEEGVPPLRRGGWGGLSTVRGRYALFLNHAGEGPLPERIDVPEIGPVTLERSLWPGEVAVRWVVAGETAEELPLAARRAVPTVVAYLRNNVPALADSLLTHTGHALFPLTAGRVDGPAPLANLVGAGPWASGADPADLTARLAAGEAAGSAAVAAVAEESPAATQLAPVALPEREASDVLVVGGGTAGALAAIAAGRQGAKTTLLEAGTFLGGIGAGGGIHCYYHGVTGGLQDELDRRVDELEEPFGGAHRVVGFHPEAKRVVLQQMAEEAGVEIVYEATASQVLREGRRVRGVLAATPAGFGTFAAAATVDSTGDGDVAALAGAPFTLGRTTDGLTHAYSQSCGRLDGQGRLAFLNFDAGYCDATDVRDLTRARLRGVSHYWREDGYTAANRLLYLAPLLGLRQCRQVVGDYRQTLDDQIRGQSFDDTIAYIHCHYDNHAFDYENESEEALVWCWLLGFWPRPMAAEVPYRCLLPSEVEGLLVACRALSLTHDAHMAFRMQRDMQRVGEAAGVAAALAAQRGITPRELEVTAVQAVLRESGALRADRRIDTPQRTPEEWAATLEGEEANLAVWYLMKAGEAAVPPLLDVLRGGSRDARFRAAAALALLGRPEGRPDLRAAIRERSAEVPLPPGQDPRRYHAAPRWMPALALVARLGDTESLPLVVDVLETPHPDLDTLILAIRSLARLGDERALEPLWRLLERDDLPTERVLQVSVPGGQPVSEDARWQIDLALAEALHALGDTPPEALIVPHLTDERAYVRRYAARVAAEVGWAPERLRQGVEVAETWEKEELRGTTGSP